jgi:hypothetical protein
MVTKVYTLNVTVPAGAKRTRLSYLTTPAGIRRTLRELRAYFSNTSGVQIYLYWETEYIAQINAEVWNKYPIPYSFDLEIPAGTGVYIEGASTATTDTTVILELVVEETRA